MCIHECSLLRSAVGWCPLSLSQSVYQNTNLISILFIIIFSIRINTHSSDKSNGSQKPGAGMPIIVTPVTN